MENVLEQNCAYNWFIFKGNINRVDAERDFVTLHLGLVQIYHELQVKFV